MSPEPVWKVTILGCGSSGGVPRPDGDWGACDPGNPKNRRRRCSILVEYADTDAQFDTGERTRIVVDTSPDFREQMLSAGVKRLDGVIFTHDHADQTHGIDDLRPYVLRARKRMPVWMLPETASSLTKRFKYIFTAREGSPYPAILDLTLVDAEHQDFHIPGPGGDMPVQMARLEHGGIIAAGYRFGPFAYSPDVSGIPDASFALVRNIPCWIVDALRETPHPTHASVSDALDWLERSMAGKGILTNLHVDLDYAALSERLPEIVTPAYDGMTVDSRNINNDNNDI
ncbi:MBL fold metallo-hydrolase [Hyphobacterium sp. HN65]|uniref:MBL fold metallo-hydrolase n=1 Tax=Hyphobacterium lacteum TaxID=3116575 RepID=A0ABU7LM48_9PROT|nr:MBL fold metallo-hydrolase [Hyphobacterium sp. HN65]MEE2524952.1 MBL fold metallo-hydrolase [Hyphobacterium sp. HN65]